MLYFYCGLCFLFGIGITCVCAVWALRSEQARYIRLLQEYKDKVKDCDELRMKLKLKG